MQQLQAGWEINRRLAAGILIAWRNHEIGISRNGLLMHNDLTFNVKIKNQNSSLPGSFLGAFTLAWLRATIVSAHSRATHDDGGADLTWGRSVLSVVRIRWFNEKRFKFSAVWCGETTSSITILSRLGDGNVWWLSTWIPSYSLPLLLVCGLKKKRR